MNLEIVELAKVGFEEFYQTDVDKSINLDETNCTMTKEQYKQQQRQQRIDKNDTGHKLGLVMTGQRQSSFNNSHIWELRNSIAAEVAPQIRQNQLAWQNN